MRSKILATATAFALAIPGTGAMAQGFPTRNVTMVVNSPAGGTADLVARVFKDEMGAALGQPVVIENRPGAGGLVGARYVAQSKPDGYTVLWSASPAILFVPPMMKGNAGFDPFNDIDYVAPTVDGPGVFAADPRLPATLREFVAMIKAKPGMNYATSGAGTPAHLAIELMLSLTGAKMEHVSYRTPAEAMVSVIQGDGNIFMSSLTTAIPFIQEGKIRALAVTGDRRAKQLPDVRTTTEAGFPDLQMPLWHAIMAPKGTPEAVLEQLRASVKQTLAKQAIRTRLEDQLGYIILETPPAAFIKRVQSEAEVWRKVITQANITLN